ncbi:MAG: enoyl-CoA hydratase [Gammaproteobacteria bacterium]|nr:enoyl-CoA hydratase [Gammaproteobacteria bacterium]
MTHHTTLCELDARGVATVTLNRPEVNNAYNGEMLQSLLDAFAALDREAGLRLVVLRGNGPHFQAGADLTWLLDVSARDPEFNLEASRLTAQVVRGLNEFRVPTLALIHGFCIGGGTGVAAACDVVIAEQSAKFAISEARWGLMASVIFPQLNAAIGERQARRYAVTCERFNAEEARRIGLVHEVCVPGGLDAAASPVIEGILMAGPEAVAGTKRGLMACAGSIMEEEKFSALVASHSAKRQSREAAEGLRSFVEKRNPAWFPAT